MTEDIEKSISELSEAELREIENAFDDPIVGHRGAAHTSLFALLGYWRRENGSNLRIGHLQGSRFTSASGMRAGVSTVGDKLSVVLRQLYLPNLPYENCVAQITWQASHSFSDNSKAHVTHITSCDATRACTAGAVGLPIFTNLKVDDLLELSISIYVMADQESQPILDLLQNSNITGGLKLAEEFIPVFAMTSPYVSAAIKGLVKSSKRNFKLVKWTAGFGLVEGYPISLSYGDYILLNGTVREGRKDREIKWTDLTWDDETDRPKYKDGPLRVPYIVLSILRS